MTSDKGCQYCVNLKTRFGDKFPALAAIVEKLRVLVPKLHLQGHRELCRFVRSLNYTRYCGRTDGEGVERPWDHSNETARITRDQNPGHRKDTYDDMNGDWNYRKLVQMGAWTAIPSSRAAPSFFFNVRCSDAISAKWLLTKLRESYRSREEAELGFDILTEAMNPADVAEWSKQSTEPVIKDGEVYSVYRANRVKSRCHRQGDQS